MEIELKTGEKLILEVTPLFLEYIEDYEGGFEQLQIDVKKDECARKTTNHLLYAIIASCYDEELTYRQAVRLVKLEDVPEIINFINKELPNIQNIQKKTQKHRF